MQVIIAAPKLKELALHQAPHQASQLHKLAGFSSEGLKGGAECNTDYQMPRIKWCSVGSGRFDVTKLMARVLLKMGQIPPKAATKSRRIKAKEFWSNEGTMETNNTLTGSGRIQLT